ncbi:MAG: hypothetical protein R3E18_04480 [Sphingomonadaceae bacterium]|nr:hypothetical protein [Sphingomonadaceae bacterium]
MAIFAIFMLGIGNFALHRAVLESRHPLFGDLSSVSARLSGRITLGIEFAVLLAAMLFAAHGWPSMAWGYGAYSVVNAVAGWLIITRKL